MNPIYVFVTFIVGGGLLAASKEFFSDPKNKKVLAAKEMWRPERYQNLPLTVLSDVRSKSPELGEWLTRLYESPDGTGIYQCPKDPQVMRIWYGHMDCGLRVVEGRCTDFLVGDKEYRINSDTWSRLVEEETSFQIIHSFS